MLKNIDWTEDWYEEEDDICDHNCYDLVVVHWYDFDSGSRYRLCLLCGNIVKL